MKKVMISMLALAACLSAHGLPTDTLPEPFENRELPRTQIISYNSEDAASIGSHAESAYLQSLTEGWQRVESRGGDHAVFSNKFKLPFSWVDREVFVYVGSATNAYQVWVNGEKVGSNMSAATAAEFDVTPYAKENVMNELEIMVSRDQTGRIGNGAGTTDVPSITGEVYVVAQPRIRIRDYVASTSFQDNEAIVELGVVVKSHLLNEKSVRVFYKLVAPDGSTASEGYKDVTLKMRQEDTVRFLGNVRNPRAWSSERPDLYKLHMKLQHEGRYTEYVCRTMGLRNVSFSAGQLYVNRSPVTLSVAEYGQRGDSQLTMDNVEAIKLQGYNAIKVTGAPQPGYFYGYCDQMGLYVCDQADINTSKYGEARTAGGNPVNDPARVKEFTDRALSMYYTSRNHASVVMFSIAENSANGYNLYESYRAIKAVEPSCPVVYPDAGDEWNSDTVSGQLRSSDPQAAGDRITFSVGKPEVQAGSALSMSATEKRGLYKVTNRGAEAVRAQVLYTIKQGKKTLSQGSVPVEVAAGETVNVMVPTPPHKGKKPLVYEVGIR